MAGMNEDRISATAPPEPATPSHQIPSDPPSDSVTSGPVSSGAVSSDPAPPGVLAEQTEAFAGRLFEAYISCLEVLAVQLGDDLGLYRALAAADWSTAAELAAAAGIHERYAREWLEQQAVAGVLEVDQSEVPAAARRYHLPEAHRPVLLDPSSPAYLVPGAALVSSIAQVLPRVVAAYRAGGGVSYADYGSRLAHGIAAMNGSAYQADLGSTWLRRAGGRRGAAPAGRAARPRMRPGTTSLGNRPRTRGRAWYRPGPGFGTRGAGGGGRRRAPTG